MLPHLRKIKYVVQDIIFQQIFKVYNNRYGTVRSVKSSGKKTPKVTKTSNNPPSSRKRS